MSAEETMMTPCAIVEIALRKNKKPVGLDDAITAAAQELVRRAKKANRKIELHDPTLPWRVQPSPYLQALFRG